MNLLSNFKILKSNQHGVTLVEIILYIALLSIVLFIAVDLMVKTSETSLESESRTALQEDGRYITNRIAYDIHRAMPLLEPSAVGTPAEKISMTIVTGSGTSDTHEYELVGESLVFRRISGTTNTANLNTNQTKINSLSFTRLENSPSKPAIKITFELEAIEGQKGEPDKKTFETIIQTR